MIWRVLHLYWIIKIFLIQINHIQQRSITVLQCRILNFCWHFRINSIKSWDENHPKKHTRKNGIKRRNERQETPFDKLWTNILSNYCHFKLLWFNFKACMAHGTSLNGVHTPYRITKCLNINIYDSISSIGCLATLWVSIRFYAMNFRVSSTFECTEAHMWSILTYELRKMWYLVYKMETPEWKKWWNHRQKYARMSWKMINKIMTFSIIEIAQNWEQIFRSADRSNKRFTIRYLFDVCVFMWLLKTFIWYKWAKISNHFGAISELVHTS